MNNHTIAPLRQTTADLPGYIAGTWSVDLVHSSAAFTARHLISKVHGRFRDFAGELRTGDNPLDSAVTVRIDAASIDTGNAQRDEHLRSEDFLEVATYPRLSFTSTGLRTNGADFLIDGDLTIKDVTRPITADLVAHGFTPDQDGRLRAGFSATFEINRKDFNVSFHWVLETGGAMVGDRVAIQLDIEAVHQP